MNHPVVSIIVPTYQRAHILGRAYQSVANQTFQNWELLIVDDGSTDGTEGIVNHWNRKDSRIRFLKRPESRPKGPSACRNIGIENAQGTYVAFLDSDDEWLPQRLEAAVGFIEKSGVKAIYSGALVQGKKANYMRASRSLKNGESVFDFILNPETFAQTSTLVLHKDIASQVSFLETMTHHEDYDFFIKVSRLTEWTYFENYDVVVHWEDNSKRKVNYGNCLDFFTMYKYESQDRDLRIKYLSYMSEDLVSRGGETRFLKKYQSLLKEEGLDLSLRKRFLFLSPRLFRVFQKIRSWAR